MSHHRSLCALSMSHGRVWFVIGLALLSGMLASRAAALPLDSTISAGATHSVSVHSDGTLWAAGNNDAGQLGDGTTTHRATPVQIGSANNWAAVAAGERHTVALQTNGTLWAWGDNTFAQIGDGTTSARQSPVRVGIATDWVAVAAGGFHTLALKSDRTLWAWGSNVRGQLGNGTTLNQMMPVQVFTNVKALAAGYQHTVVVAADGGLWAWGLNGYGQVGNGWIQDQWNPVRIGTDSSWAGVAAGQFHTLAWRSDGSLWTWGHNASGQLGIASLYNQWSPVQVTAVADVIAAVGGKAHSAALRRNGTLWAWGLNSDGQVGDGSLTDRPAPIQIGTATHWTTLAAGHQWTAALTDSGRLWVWGQNTFGQLGTGLTSNQRSPTRIGTENNWAHTRSGASHNLAVKTNGTLWAWGSNPFGQLGDGSTVLRSTPKQIGSATDWSEVAAGLGHSVGVRRNGTLWTWGLNSSGQLGDGTAIARTQPQQVGSATNWLRVAAGDLFTLAIKSDGTLWAWGQNSSGQLGDGTTSTQWVPKQIGAATNWARVVAGKSHALALKTDGSLWSWGYNGYGQLGDGTNVGHVSPAQVGTASWLRIAAGNNHSLAIKNDGTLWAWGDNARGQLGDLSFFTKWAPVPVAGASTWSDIAAGANHTVARKADGAMWAWGSNNDGQVGDGSATNRPAPVAIGAGTTWRTMTGGAKHSAAVAADGRLFSWGSNASGQLGLGDSWRPAPALNAPVVTVFPPRTVIVGATYSYTFAAVDLDGGRVTFAERALPSWLSFNPTSGVLSGSPRAGDVGVHNVVLTASDGVLTTVYRFSVDVSGGAALNETLNLNFEEGSSALSIDGAAATPRAEFVDASWTVGFDGGALMVNGPGYARVPDQAELNFGEALTLEAWVKPTASGQDAYVISKAGDLANQFPYGLGLRAGALHATLNNQAYVSDYVVPRDVWSHVAMAWDGAVLRLYANGETVLSAAVSSTLLPSTQPLLVGARDVPGGAVREGFVGAVDRVGLWRVSRTASELCVAAGREWNGAECTGTTFGNSAPVAAKNSFTLTAGGVLIGNLVATDDNAGPLTYLLVNPPTHGTVQILNSGTGAFRYTPATVGADQFTFRVVDHFGASANATVTLTVNEGDAVDSDNDGMSDVIESALGLNMNAAADATLDADQDGVSNYNEVVSGRDPTIAFETDAQHVLGISFHEGAGNVAHDATVAANNGTLVGGATWTAGPRGNALSVAATSGVSVPDDASLDITGALAIELWIKPATSGQTGYVLAKNTAGSAAAFNYGLGLVNGRLRGVLSGTYYPSAFVVPVNAWTHVALTWDGTKVRLYANGVELVAANRTAALSSNAQALILGARSTAGKSLAQGFDGELDQVNIWRGALSAAEICSASAGTYAADVCTH